MKKPNQKEITDFEQSLLDSEAYQGYAMHFRVLYQFCQYLIKPALLAISVFLSTMFIANAFGGSQLAFIAGFALSCVIAGAVGFGTDRLIGYTKTQKSIDVLLTVITVMAYGFNIFCDYNSAETVGSLITGEKPTDTQTEMYKSTYTPQITDINNQIAELERLNFYYCPVHSTYKGVNSRFHICNHPKNQRHVNKKDSGDLLALDKIEELNEAKTALQLQMNGLIAENGQRLNNELSSYDNALERNQNYSRYTSLVCSTFFFLISLWTKNYALRSVKEIQGKTDTVTPKRKSKRKNAKQKDSVNEEVEEAFNKLVNENTDLREEMQALADREAELRKKI